MKHQVSLAGEDGNVFRIIAWVSQALKSARQHKKAKEFQERALHSSSYDEVLQLCFEYVDPF